MKISPHNFNSFREFLDSFKESPDNISYRTFNREDSFEMIQEGIIIPTFDISDSELSLDIDKLNSKKYFKDLNIRFTDAEDSTYSHDTGIVIGMEHIENLKQLKSSVKHELIHAIQFERSSGKYIEYAKSLEKNFSKAARAGKFTSSEKFYQEYENVKYKINFDNPYEKMAYAFQMVYVYIDKFSRDELIKLIQRQFPEWQRDKQFLKYVYHYYEIHK